MTALAEILEGNAWQDFAEQLLVMHYGPTEYTPFPDTMGDGGIEGFTTCGCAFQAYGAEKTKVGKELYADQRDKMTRDINTFIKNKAMLAKLFGDVKIRRWVLIVPRVGLKDLKAHANKMTKKVRDANLPFVTDDFIVTYCDQRSFANERDRILASKNNCIELDADRPDAAKMDEWEADHRPLTEKLDDKLTRLEPGSNEVRRDRIRQQMLSWHLHGKALMTKLNDTSPTVFERVFKAKTDYEQVLVQHELTATDARQQLKEVMGCFKTALQNAAKSLNDQTATFLVLEAIADWMLRCPLDFREDDIDA